jgi:hypothetical protein
MKIQISTNYPENKIKNISNRIPEPIKITEIELKENSNHFEIESNLWGDLITLIALLQLDGAMVEFSI